MNDKQGRPRDTRLDAAITAAVERILLADGYASVTIDRVAREAGTTRAAVYRRYNSRGSMVAGLLVARFGVDPAPDTGRLAQDLEALQRLQVDFFAHPVICASIAGVLSDIAADPALGSDFHACFVVPRRKSVADLLERAASRGEITTAVKPSTVSDLLTGPLLLHAALPALGPPGDELVRATVNSALAVLGHQPPAC